MTLGDGLIHLGDALIFIATLAAICFVAWKN